MWYRGSIEVGIEQTEDDPAIAEVEICQGVITRFYRLFPPGCAGKVSLQVYHQTRQIFPTTPGQAYIGDASEILGVSSADITEPPFLLVLRGWAPESTYAHIVYCEFYIESTVRVAPVGVMSVVLPGV